MGFIVWHYLVRIGLVGMLPLLVVAFALPRNGMASTIGGVAAVGMAILGGSGAVLAVRLLIRGFRFACPGCKGRETDFGMSRKKAMWLYCPKCGVFEESGFLKLKISHHAEGMMDEEEEEEDSK